MRKLIALGMILGIALLALVQFGPSILFGG